MTMTRRQVVVGGVVSALAVAAEVAVPLTKHLLSDSGSYDLPGPSEAKTPLPEASQPRSKQATQPALVQPRLMGSQDPSFNSALDTMFPGLRQNRRFAKLLPFSAIVVNTASHPIFGYALRWHAISKSGVKESYRRHFFNGPTLQLGRRQVTGQEGMLKPGASGIVTPLFFWPALADDGSASNLRLTRKKWRNYKSLAIRAHGFVLRHARTVNLMVSMDARVYAAKARGRNPELAAKDYRSRRNGEHDQAFSFLTRCVGANGALDQKLLEKQIASATDYFREAAQNGQQKPYSLARARFAQKVKFCLGTYGLDRVQQVLETVNGISRTRLSVS